jgi:hypothetical protein
MHPVQKVRQPSTRRLWDSKGKETPAGRLVRLGANQGMVEQGLAPVVGKEAELVLGLVAGAEGQETLRAAER